MATKKLEKVDEVVEPTAPSLVEVEYLLGAFNTTLYGNGFRVEFIDGKAKVTAEVANELAELKLIK